MLGDWNGDGRGERLPTRFNAPSVVGGSLLIGSGGYMIVNGNAASNGRSQFAVSTISGQLLVFQRAATGMTAVQVGSPNCGVGQTGAALCCAGTIGGVAAMASSGNQRVFLENSSGALLGVTSPPSGTPLRASFGTAPAFFANPVSGTARSSASPDTSATRAESTWRASQVR